MPLPNDPIRWTGAMDPGEVLDFEMDLVSLLEEGEAISSFTLTMSPEGAALGVSVQTAPRAPELLEAGTVIRLWLGVDEAFRSNAAWSDSGLDIGVTATIVTNSSPSRTRERTFAATIKQR